MVMSNGLVLDDNGFAVSISSQPLHSGDSFTGGLDQERRGHCAILIQRQFLYRHDCRVTNGTLAGIRQHKRPDGGRSGRQPFGAGVQGEDRFTLHPSATTSPCKATPGCALTRPAVHRRRTGYRQWQHQLRRHLTVTNTTSDATPLTTSDTFQLFNVSGSKSGNFAGIAGSPGTGLAYSFNPASGVLSIITQTIANNPTNITFSVSGNTLTLSWPSDHLGWILQSQTNSINAGLSANWFDVIGSGSSTQ